MLIKLLSPLSSTDKPIPEAALQQPEPAAEVSPSLPLTTWFRIHCALLFLLRCTMSSTSRSPKTCVLAVEPETDAEPRLAAWAPPPSDSDQPCEQFSCDTSVPLGAEAPSMKSYLCLFHYALQRSTAVRELPYISPIERRFFTQLIHDLRQFLASTSSSQKTYSTEQLSPETSHQADVSHL